MKKYILTAIVSIGFVAFANQLKAQVSLSDFPVKTFNFSLKGSTGSSPNITSPADKTNQFFKDSVTVDIKITSVSGKVYSSNSKFKMTFPAMPIILNTGATVSKLSDINGGTLDVTFNFPPNASGQYTYLIDYSITPVSSIPQTPASAIKTVSYSNNSINKSTYKTSIKLSGF
jgi:hypothetical protein